MKLEHLETTVATLASNLLAELRLLRQEAVRSDVYNEQRRADQAEIAALRKELEQRASQADMTVVKEEMKENRQRKWTVWLAVTAAVIAIGRDVIQTLLTS